MPGITSIRVYFQHFLRLKEEYIISLSPTRPHTQPQTHRASAYRDLAHGPWPSLAYGA